MDTLRTRWKITYSNLQVIKMLNVQIKINYEKIRHYASLHQNCKKVFQTNHEFSATDEIGQLIARNPYQRVPTPTRERARF